ncbi:MAG: cytochrome-c peroxidase [Bacteroidetes bacterium]|nr:cytochrome-c peroxidase [Bacteroidota bacterium]HMU14032.1 cytochrome c peroxidase [Flavobacteriales bacterium]HRT53845.1 cytochrome c peroxidase [Flavobacteriales bacterium]
MRRSFRDTELGTVTLLHMRPIHPTLLCLLGLILLFGCRKESSSNDDPGSGGQTPFTLHVPIWVDTAVGPQHEAPGNPLTFEGIALGRRLFHDVLLSDDYTQSCATCHKQANGFSDPAQFSTGTNGAHGTRNAMAVINLGWDGRFFWDGRRNTLEEQAHDPVTNPIEMRNTWPEVVARLQAHADYPGLFERAFGTPDIDSNKVVMAIAQFERTLLSFNSRFDRLRYMGDSSALNEQEYRGLDIFMRDGHCVDCHTEPLFSDPGMRNTGLELIAVDSGLAAITGNPADIGKFKVPTLRNIAQSAPYMHDGRFATLEEVVNFYAHDVQITLPNLDGHMDPWRFGLVNLSPQNEADLVAFLHTLTDTAFLTNPALGPP